MYIHYFTSILRRAKANVSFCHNQLSAALMSLNFVSSMSHYAAVTRLAPPPPCLVALLSPATATRPSPTTTTKPTKYYTYIYFSTKTGRDGKRDSRGLPGRHGGLQLLQPGRVHGDPRPAVRVLSALLASAKQRNNERACFGTCRVVLVG